jgi:protein-L-isoaspartate(D-aspartate) O-methyltransferase
MDARLLDAFAIVPRWRFLPPAERPFASMNAPLPIGFGVTNSQPSTVADMLGLLDVQAGHAVLDVGAGSGWTTALLAQLVGPTGRVFGVERIPELAVRAADAVVDWPWARVRASDPGVLGSPGEAPFDRILVSAMAADLPAALVDQLTTSGVLVVPVAGVMLRVTRSPDGAVVVTEHGWYSFVPLIP